MSDADFLNKHAVEYPAGTPPLASETVQRNLSLVPGWELVDEGKGLRLTRRMADFRAVMELLNRVAELAEEEQHHPDVRIYAYRMLELNFTTHSVGGLTDNDFIMASKVNRLLAS